VGAVFKNDAVDCTEHCLFRFIVELSSGIIRWTLLKIILYMLVVVAFFRYSEVDCILVGVGERFSVILRWTVLKNVLYWLVGGSSRHV